MRKAVHDVEPAASKRSSNDVDSVRPHIGDDLRSRSAQGSPVPGSSLKSERRISDIGKLTLGQNHIETPSRDAPTSPSTLYNPLKRGVAEDIVSSEEENRNALRSRACRARAVSGGPYGSPDPGSLRPHGTTSDPRFSRNSPGLGKRLFNPELDNPVIGIAALESLDRKYEVCDIGDPSAKITRPKRMSNLALQDQPKLGPLHGYGKQKSVRIIKANREANDYPNLDHQFGIVGESDRAAVAQDHGLEMDQELDPDPVLLLQPETRPISHDQLVVEVKGIYAGLTLVETKCKEVDEKQSKAAQETDPSRQTKLTDEQWQALIHLHKTLLHEHHDFFLASQHPSATPALSRLAAQHAMPGRMWRYGIHAFLEVLRYRLPQSLDHMLAFIYIAYSMVALLYETVTMFEDTWIECLGDLGRYRMAVEDDDPRDRDVWSGVARYWYSKGADKRPKNGRLYHHLAILARPYSLQQLSLYTRSLTSIEPFDGARASIKTLFNPILSGKDSAYHRPHTAETTFIKTHGLLFSGLSIEQFDTAVHQLLDGLFDNYIGRITLKFREQGVCVMLANISALFEYGLPRSIFRLSYDKVQQANQDKITTQNNPLNMENAKYNTSHPSRSASTPRQVTPEDLTPNELKSSEATIACASRLTFSMLSVALQRVSDKNVWPLAHVSLVFLWSLTIVDKAMEYVERDVPWTHLCSYLNNLSKSEAMTAKVLAATFPQPEGAGRPLPEDFVIRGQVYSQWYFPDGWFTDAVVDDEERTQDLPSMVAPRIERILWLGMRIASVSPKIQARSSISQLMENSGQ